MVESKCRDLQVLWHLTMSIFGCPGFEERRLIYNDIAWLKNLFGDDDGTTILCRHHRDLVYRDATDVLAACPGRADWLREDIK